MQDLFSLEGRTALITGSSRGIGYTLARGLGRAGAIVILNGRDEDRLMNAVSELKVEGLNASGYAFDVRDSAAIRKQIENIRQDVGDIDILVNNAGIQIRAPMEEFGEADWHKILDINLTGAFLVSRTVVAGMIQRKAGKIINICSIQSELARPNIAPYSAAKGGLKMLTRAMATEWGKYNIQANGLAPGYFRTELTKPLYENEKFDAWLCSRTPANRWGEPEELIGAAVFLASKASDYVNGHILYVDGGMLACV
ncbi:MAG: SDR family oxidoreductase [Candidatus Neomarinimicrobiota bacterium]